MATALVMGVMIGSGVFLLPAQLAPFGWNAVAAWGLSIIGALALALVIARLTTALPDANGPTGFVGSAFGPVPGFLIGWSYWVSNTVAVVTLAVAAVSYLSVFAPAIATRQFLPSLLAVALVWLMTIINLRGARAAGAFQLLTMAVKVLPLLVVIVILALLLTRPDLGPHAPASLPSQALSLSSITGAATLTLWALTGFESASLAAAAVEKPEINVPRATIIGTALTGLLYMITVSGIALVMPPELITGSDAPFATFVEYFWAREPALLIALFAAVSAIGSISGMILVLGELPVAMARQGNLPQWFGATNAKGTPSRALILSSIVASLFVLINASKSMSDLFTFLAKLSTCAALWLYLGCALAALCLKVAVPIAALGAVYSLWALWGAGWDVSALSFVLMAAGLPLYWWAKQKERPAHVV
jgi:basic amino acid/polyamine antiporter, APA family